jgi:hypothetical protein
MDLSGASSFPSYQGIGLTSGRARRRSKTSLERPLRRRAALPSLSARGVLLAPAGEETASMLSKPDLGRPSFTTMKSSLSRLGAMITWNLLEVGEDATKEAKIDVTW